MPFPTAILCDQDRQRSSLSAPTGVVTFTIPKHGRAYPWAIHHVEIPSQERQAAVRVSSSGLTNGSDHCLRAWIRSGGDPSSRCWVKNRQTRDFAIAHARLTGRDQRSVTLRRALPGAPPPRSEVIPMLNIIHGKNLRQKLSKSYARIPRH